VHVLRSGVAAFKLRDLVAHAVTSTGQPATSSLMRKKRADPKTFDFTHPCPECGYKFQPAELLRTG
jgi:hypothetical protein